MKKLLPIVVLSLFFIAAYPQIQVQPKNAVETGFLYDLSSQLSGIENFDGSINSPLLRHATWNQIYFELSKSNLTQMEFASLSAMHREAKIFVRNSIIPLGLLYFRYNALAEKPEKTRIKNGVLDISEMQMNTGETFAATAFRDETFNGSHLVFSLPEEFIFSNQNQSISKIFIDFEDGSGWRQVTPGDKLSVKYNSTGKKTIQIKAVLIDQRELYSKFNLVVKRLETPAPTATWLVESDIAYNGVTTTGDAYVLLSDQNTKLTRPVIVCEGIDFDDSYTWETLYELFNQQNMLEDMRAQGYDLVVLNFHSPLTYIQSNGYLFAKLVQMVNDSISYASKVSVVGPSMGGMVTRFALTYMEANNIDHNCNLWISFEAPHQGANIPLGLQYAVFFFRDLDANVQMLLDILNEPAPRQMLAYHYTDPPTSPAGNDALFDTFQNELGNMGSYPENLRKIAISNGRGDAVGQPYNAGDQAIEFEYNSFIVDILGNMWTVKDNASGLVFQGLIDPLIGATSQLNANIFSPKPYDNAPGGMRSSFAEMGEIELPFGELVVLLDNHAYIPTVSGLDIDTDDLFYNVAGDPLIMKKTPFDSIYWANDNYDHIYISPETAQHIIAEIENVQTQTQNVLLLSGWNDLSSYIDPSDTDIENIVNQLGNNLVILQHFDEVYWPEGGFSTLTEWNYKKGYLIKVNSDSNLDILGKIPSEKSIEIVQGWNLIPALCMECNYITDILGNNIDKVKIIKEGVGFGIFWPEMGIYTLTHFFPGSAYYLYANESFLLTFE